MTGKGAAVVVDCRLIRSTGIGRYTREVISGLLRDDRFSSIALLGGESTLRELYAEAEGAGELSIHAYPERSYSPAAWIAWRRHLQAGRRRGSVVFFPHYDVPPAGVPPRSVVTIHDLIHFRLKGMFPAWKRVLARGVMARAVRQAGSLITVSEFSAADLVDRHPRAREKLSVVPNGVAAVFLDSAPPPAPVPEALEDGARYILCVGNRKANKNLVAALEVVALLRGRGRPMRLVVAGRPDPAWKATLERARTMGIEDAVVDVGEVDDAQLVQLYAGCAAFLFPSLFEGWGLPVLEAMACGAPVVASRRSSIPEVAGDAAVLTEPEDHRGMAEAILRLELDPAFRERMIRRGRARAALFPWERSVERTADILYETATRREMP